MFTTQTPLVEIKDALCSHDNYCDDIKLYFKDYNTMTYGEAINNFEENYHKDKLMNGRFIVNLNLLAKYNDISINDRLLRVVMKYDIMRNMQLLFLWRKIKNFPNISKSVKENIVNKIRGTLPKAEKQGDWDYD